MLEGIFANGFEHRVAWLASVASTGLNQVFVHQRGEALEEIGAKIVVSCCTPLRRLRAYGPPEKTERRRNSFPSASFKRPWLQSIVSASVCCRSGRSRAPPVSNCKRLSNRSNMARGESIFVRAAASSIARGSPSRRRQTSWIDGTIPNSARTRAEPPRRVARRVRLRRAAPESFHGKLLLAIDAKAGTGWSPEFSEMDRLRDIPAITVAAGEHLFEVIDDEQEMVPSSAVARR